MHRFKPATCLGRTTIARRSDHPSNVLLCCCRVAAHSAPTRGVYAALAEAELHPDWVAGISIGAINGALIAGNAPERRVEQLRKFWEQITASTHGLDAWPGPLSETSDTMRGWINQASAAMALFGGAPGFFAPRLIAPWFAPAGGTGATSYYETANLRSTLERLVDFDRINESSVRFTVGAVNVRSGNLVCFDTETHRIGPEHVMASGALPPGFPAIEIEGEHYWDGGLVSNTPLEWVVENVPRQDTLAFQVDLWSARRFPSPYGRNRDATEGDHLFEPNAREHEQLQAHAKDATCGGKIERRYARARPE
jgi:NTE family protein